jgi:hydrogenase/urease accessory protein HupE
MRLYVFALLAALAWPLAGLAHEVRPSFLELRETASGEFSVLWKTPMLGNRQLALEPQFSGETAVMSSVTTQIRQGAALHTWAIRAPALRGQMMRIAGLEGTMTDALVHIEFADGTNWTQRLTPHQPAATIPAHESPLAVAAIFLRLGIEHILTGVDHLLFVLALLIIARGPRRLLITVTGFTVAHSITLALATLGLVHVPQRPVEAVIALSIAVVAMEIVHRRRGAPSVTTQAPWVVAVAFGLLHGFGFAGALSEIGLPEGRIPLALLCFNVGVELGQLFFIAGMLSLIAVMRRLPFRFPAWSELVLPYAIGTLSMFWVFQRLAAF